MKYWFIMWLNIFSFAVLTTVKACSAKTTLVFSIDQQQSVYKQSIYGEPPQFAMWLVNSTTKKIRTVAVTQRAATGIFEGKSAVPVALPAWIGAFRAETGRNDTPSPKSPIDNVDAISLPTPKTKRFKVTIEVPEDSHWYYYIEVNVAGDYNSEFPAFKSNGVPDRYGNGQPSIIYRGEITASPGIQSTPELIGRTEQMYFSTEIITDLTGIENAKELFSRISIICKNEVQKDS